MRGVKRGAATVGASATMGGLATKRGRETARRAAGSALTFVAALACGPTPLEAQETAVEVPLSVEAGRLAVTVTGPAGAEMRFALSTGSATTVLTESAAARLGSGAELALGGVPVPVEGAHTVPDAQLADGGFSGMIGVDVLGAHDVLLDVPGGRLLLAPVGPAVSWPGMALGEPRRLRVYHGVVLGLDVELDGRPLQAQLDIGTPAVVVNEGARPEGMTGDEGTTTLSLGATRLEDLPLIVRDLSVFERWDPDGRGFVLVGAPIAWDCAVSLSWAHAEIRTCVR